MRRPALARLRADGRVDLVLCDLAHDVGAVVRALAAERIAVPVVACGTGDDAEAAARAIREGAREFLPLPPDPDLIAAILEAAAGESHAMVVRDPAMAAGRAPRRAGRDVRCVGADHRRVGHRQGGAGAPHPSPVAPRRGSIRRAELRRDPGQPAGVGAVRPREGRVLRRCRAPHRQVRGGGRRHTAARRNQRDGYPPAGRSCCARLQEREIDRLGGAAPVRVNVRILATTNRDLLAEVQRGTFREDLYFRLNVVSLRIPPLRERPGDIAALAEHFARRYADVNGLPFRPLSRDAVLRLTSHGWRGNVRELENVDPSRRAAGRWRGRSASRRSSWVRLPPDRAAGAADACGGGIAYAGRAADGGGGARSDHRDARPHAGQPHACGDHPRHLDPRAAQQAARLRRAGRRGAAAAAGVVRPEPSIAVSLAARGGSWSVPPMAEPRHTASCRH